MVSFVVVYGNIKASVMPKFKHEVVKECWCDWSTICLYM